VTDSAPIPFNRPYFTGRERAYIDEVLASRNIAGDGAFAHRLFLAQLAARGPVHCSLWSGAVQ